jgi:signal transduction histidine kinase
LRATPTDPAREIEQARRLELGLILVRTFSVFLGFYLILETNAGPPPHASDSVLALSYALIGLLGGGNLMMYVIWRRASTLGTLQKLGLAAFLFDAVIIFSFAWIYSYDPKGSTWVIVYILPLEGALRYQLEGALASVALTLANEIAREQYLANRFAARYPFLWANVAFRVGIDLIIAVVAGFMSRSLAKEAARAAEEARRAEQVAQREMTARRELAAFNTAILTGVAAEDLDQSIRLMAEAIGRDLQFESFSILLREGDHLVVKGMYGMPFYGAVVPIGRGVTGTVAATARALIVPDVGAFPDYIEADPEMRSEMAAPMRIGDDLIGVLDVESRQADAFDQASLDILVRLADQIALVAHSNRLLSQQSETVQRLQELDQMKSDFVAITSHELRTPITSIRGFIKTLLRSRDRLTPEQVGSFMEIIDRQSARLARLVEDLLFVSRIEAGTLRLAMEEVELDRFLKETVEAFGPDRKSRVEIRTEPVDATVVIDPQRVEQVLRNLVDNALKFSPSDAPVMLEGRVTGESVELSVTDRGRGIAPEDQRRIFDRFHQAGEVLSRDQEGAGLGLYITKRLVEVLGGTIELESRPGMGATFRVRIPAGEKATRPTVPAADVLSEAQGPRGDGQAEVGSPVSAPSRLPGAP